MLGLGLGLALGLHVRVLSVSFVSPSFPLLFFLVHVVPLFPLALNHSFRGSRSQEQQQADKKKNGRPCCCAYY